MGGVLGGVWGRPRLYHGPVNALGFGGVGGFEGWAWGRYGGASGAEGGVWVGSEAALCAGARFEGSARPARPLQPSPLSPPNPHAPTPSPVIAPTAVLGPAPSNPRGLEPPQPHPIPHPFNPPQTNEGYLGARGTAHPTSHFLNQIPPRTLTPHPTPKTAALRATLGEREPHTSHFPHPPKHPTLQTHVPLPHPPCKAPRATWESLRHPPLFKAHIAPPPISPPTAAPRATWESSRRGTRRRRR